MITQLVCLVTTVITLINSVENLVNPVPIRIVSEQSTRLSSTPSPKSLATVKPPANFSGPSALRLLENQCFTYLDELYQYRFCPFRNVTQHETTSNWSRFEGVLGIWSGEWSIGNNTFLSMKYRDGDLCSSKTGQIRRRVKVYPICGASNRLLNASEPDLCRYEMYFETPLICDTKNIKVYPTLDENLRSKWDLLETLRLNQLITNKAYTFQVDQIFREAGLIHRNMFAIGAEKDDEEEPQFDNLAQCKRAYKNLMKEKTHSAKI
ncbi:N-acetylglucosamine-1-phosphotransferase subunit gamma-like [Tetranychus urticae]|uniref:MRH domain-containing protein n=1 Tax=Tetranychus urticae TaxID=32264 RepID=T1K9X5_TETUR|nr:N-acetylglucosamine-1-phosphotransferase subunit gamma-like [Tetranychus urticae]